MAVTLQANALLDPTDAQVAAFLKLPASSDALITLINRASDYAEGYCNRPLKKQTFTAIRLAGQGHPHLRPLATPIDVAGTITLSVDAVALTIWKAEADGDPRWASETRIVRFFYNFRGVCCDSTTAALDREGT